MQVFYKIIFDAGMNIFFLLIESGSDETLYSI